MMVGYQGVSPVMVPGKLKGSRCPQYDSQFVEPLYSLGKWVLTYRVLTDSEQNFTGLFWHQDSDADDLYLLQQNNL